MIAARTTTRLLLPLANVAIVGFYVFNLDVPSRVLLVTGSAVLLFSMVGLFAAAAREGLLAHVYTLQLTVLSVIVVCMLLQGVAYAAPGLLPMHLRTFLETNDVRDMRRRAVEYLDASPFVKFTPNTRVRSQLYRGTDEQFAYEWTTDKRGFKNTPAVASMDQVEIVALGDSFTEGMGVATEDTWPSRLTAAGHATYNLGVQGYAPAQMEGSFRRYGADLRPRHVIIAYCATTYDRERWFFDEQAAIRRKEFTGGIDSFVGADAGRELRLQARYVVSASYVFGRAVLGDLLSRYRAQADHPGLVKRPFFERYVVEIAAVADEAHAVARGVLEASPAWTATLRRFDSILEAATAIGADVLLLYLPNRPAAYYEAATGRSLPAEYVEVVEAAALVQYARDRGIAFLNPFPRIRDHVVRLPENAAVSAYPYLELDAHMSPRGHMLVADEIRTYLERTSSR